MQALDQFLQSVQNRAFITAKLATGNADDALDLVQDSMLQLAKNYGSNAPGEWPGLFQRILQNRIKDWYRRKKVRRILYWWQQHETSEDQLAVDDSVRDRASPLKDSELQQANSRLYQAIKQLPPRQQQAFLLRAWWEHTTEETANIMGCSQGSVKTHYSRAIATLGHSLNNVLL